MGVVSIITMKNFLVSSLIVALLHETYAQETNCVAANVCQQAKHSEMQLM